MKWVKERDDLIAQTKAFVRSVTGRKAEMVAEPLQAEPLGAQKPFFAALPPSAMPGICSVNREYRADRCRAATQDASCWGANPR